MNSLVTPSRVDALEQALGHPDDPGNPWGFAAIVDADERAEVADGAEDVLTEFGLNAEFVPVAEGGRLARADELVDVMRVVYRRDPALGLGYGASSLISATNVWAAGNAEQRQTAARLLLAGRRIAVGYHELAHGNDMASTTLSARREGDQLVLRGRKEVVTNARRADALVLFARTDENPGRRSHSQVLVDRAALPTDRYRDLPRFSSVGMRGVQLGGVEFDDCPVDASGILGREGHGLETAMRSFQLTRTALPAMSTAMLDTGLQVSLDHLRSRRLYRGAATDIAPVRSVLAGTFADLLLCEAVARTGLRALHLLPGQTSVYASAVKYHLATRMLETMGQLATTLGSASYLRDGGQAIFQKMARDLKPVAFGHVSRAACQMTILPQLPFLARRSWLDGEPGPDALFDREVELPPLDVTAFQISTGGRDGILPTLPAGCAALARDSSRDGLPDVATHVVDRFRRLTEQSSALVPRDLAYPAATSAYDLTSDYVTVFAAACGIGVWRSARPDDDPFLAAPAWLHAGLLRLHAAADGRPVPVLPADVERRLLSELFRRHEARVGFGLNQRTLLGSR